MIPDPSDLPGLMLALMCVSSSTAHVSHLAVHASILVITMALSIFGIIPSRPNYRRTLDYQPLRSVAHRIQDLQPPLLSTAIRWTNGTTISTLLVMSAS